MTEAYVAETTEKTSHFSCFVIVVDVNFLVKHFTTRGTAVVLLQKHAVIIGH